MKFIIPLLLLVAVCNAGPQQSQSQPFNYQNYLASQTTTTPAPIHPPASIHYVNIGQELNGDYKFGYDTGKGPSGQSFREETRLPDGSVKGQYGYLDAQNKMRIVKYTAGLNGFSIDSDTALNDQQIAASRPVAPNPQYQSPPAAEAPRSQYNSQYSSARSSFQGLAQAAQQQYQAYLPPPTAQAQQQPYTGYSQPAQYQPAPQPAPQAAAPQYSPPQYTPNAYGSASQLTPAQLQAQALASARARQAALARQQQQEAIIRQQQQAATEQILAQQRAALEAQQAAQQAESAAQKQSNYQNLASQYAAAQPQYQPQPAPQPQYQPAPAQPAPPTYQSPQYQPASQPAYSSGASRTTELKPDVLSQFIQLPGTRLIQIDKPRPAKSAISSSLLSSSSSATKNEEEEYTGPVVINAALLNYDIGSTKLPNGQPANKRRA